MTEPKFDADKVIVAELLAALAKLIEHEPSRDDFRSDSKGDLQFEEAKADFARARAALARARGETE